MTAATAWLPRRLPNRIHVFAVGRSLFAYDIPVPEDFGAHELDGLRQRIVEELESIRSLIPSHWLGADRSVDSTTMSADSAKEEQAT